MSEGKGKARRQGEAGWLGMGMGGWEIESHDHVMYVFAAMVRGQRRSGHEDTRYVVGWSEFKGTATQSRYMCDVKLVNLKIVNRNI